ncbi:MAG: hypothetical protein JSV32_06550, partial [Dehalococcoidia bacterium]
LDIPHIGRINDANVTFKIESEGTPAIGGNITIQLIKEEVNCSIDDALLLNYTTEFTNSSLFSYEESLDLSDYLENDTITEYYGRYRLIIIISQNSTTFDNFTLSKFWLKTDTFVQAETPDTKAYYTDPALSDTDFDGWSDSYEIFTKRTNPLSEDTDADGIWDSLDVDPCRDVVIKITPISASVPGQYNLQIVSAYSIMGNDNSSFYFCTTKQQADVSESSLWSAYFDGTNGSPTELHYYANVEDLRRVLSFNIQLWYVDRYFGFVKKWDTMLTSGTDTYFIDKVGDSDILEVIEYDSEENVKYRARIKVETIGIEKSNVIAIYEKNGTTFNGHYQTQEKMNIIQLYVNDTPAADSPFVKGPNSIVVPTSLFRETILNGYIQNERLNETFFYSDNEEVFQLISVDREGNTEQANNQIDFIMIRFDISTEDAENLLDLILTCVINETLDENNNTINTNATLYSYYSTKLNGTSAVLMNLPKSVLEFVPWYCNFSDSPQGPQPKDFEDWFWAPLKAVGGIVGGLFITILMLPAIIIALVVAFVANIILMFVLPIVAYVLLLIVKVVLLVLAFILLAIHILAQVLMYLTIGVLMLAVTAVSGGYSKFSWNFVEFLIEDRVIRLESEIKWVYWEFFDMSFPWAQDQIRLNNTIYMTSKKAILDEGSEVEIADINEQINETQAPPTLHCSYDQIDETTFNFWTLYDDSNGGGDGPDANYGVRLHLIAPNGTALEPFEMSIHPDYLPDPSYDASVKYNYTIDLDTIFSEEGLWHYYFTCKDNSSQHEPTIMPIEGYFLGPETSDEPQYLFASAVSSTTDDFYCPAGFINDTFIFRTWWGCNVTPSNVSLCLIPANKTLGTGINNTFGIKKFLMNPSVQNPNYSKTVEYNCTINFFDLNYTQTEIGWFYHYYEAKFSNGNMSYLYEIDGQYEEDVDIDLSEFYYADIRAPFVASFGPQIVDYKITNFNPILIPRLNDKIYQITSETSLEFEVVYIDPFGGYPQEFYPKLIFENVVTAKNLTFTTKNYWKTPFSEKFGENA